MNTLIALALAITGTLTIDGVDYDVRLTRKEMPPVVVAPPEPGPVGEPLELIRRAEWFHLLGAQNEIMVTPYRTKANDLIGDHQMWFDNLRVTLQTIR